MKQKNLKSDDPVNRQLWRLKTGNWWTTGKLTYRQTDRQKSLHQSRHKRSSNTKFHGCDCSISILKQSQFGAKELNIKSINFTSILAQIKATFYVHIWSFVSFWQVKFASGKSGASQVKRQTSDWWTKPNKYSALDASRAWKARPPALLRLFTGQKPPPPKKKTPRTAAIWQPCSWYIPCTHGNYQILIACRH